MFGDMMSEEELQKALEEEDRMLEEKRRKFMEEFEKSQSSKKVNYKIIGTTGRFKKPRKVRKDIDKKRRKYNKKKESFKSYFKKLHFSKWVEKIQNKKIKEYNHKKFYEDNKELINKKTLEKYNNKTDEQKKLDVMKNYININMILVKELFVLSKETNLKQLNWYEKIYYIRGRPPKKDKYLITRLMDNKDIEFVYNKLKAWNKGERWEGKIEI